MKYFLDDKPRAPMICIVPTRGRPDNVQAFIDTWEATKSGFCDLLFCVDDDDASDYDITLPEGVLVEEGPRLRLGPTLNHYSRELALHYEVVGFAGDDHRFRTPGWDEVFYEDAKTRGKAVIYGNDLYQGERLPTAAFLTSNIVRAIGHMCPPGLIHLYLDNFWKELGKKGKCLSYFPEVIIEHVHPHAGGKSEWDERYEEVNSPEMYNHDREVWQKYKALYLSTDVKRVREI